MYWYYLIIPINFLASLKIYTPLNLPLPLSHGTALLIYFFVFFVFSVIKTILPNKCPFVNGCYPPQQIRFHILRLVSVRSSPHTVVLPLVVAYY